MADPLAKARHDLAVANRVVSYEGIIDAFGHVSMRHPTKPDRYLISRSRSPEVVEATDIYEYTLDSEPVTPLPDGIRVRRPKDLPACARLLRVVASEHQYPARWPEAPLAAAASGPFVRRGVRHQPDRTRHAARHRHEASQLRRRRGRSVRAWCAGRCGR